MARTPLCGTARSLTFLNAIFFATAFAVPAYGQIETVVVTAERKAEDAGAPLDVDELFVNTCFVNEGARWKRLRPAPMGRAFRYQKRTAHLWVGVAEHHVAAAERVAAIEAEAEAQKGVRGTARRVRKALAGKQGGPKKGKK